MRTARRRREPDGCTVRRSVLVVDDEVLVRMVAAESLRERGLDVLEAANAAEALDLLRSDATLDLVFTDVRMGGPIDGVGLAQIIRAQRPTVRIVITSGHLLAPEPADLADAFFVKPYALAAVTACIVNLVSDPGS